MTADEDETRFGPPSLSLSLSRLRGTGYETISIVDCHCRILLQCIDASYRTTLLRGRPLDFSFLFFSERYCADFVAARVTSLANEPPPSVRRRLELVDRESMSDDPIDIEGSC